MQIQLGRGDEVCTDCGAHIRNIVWIDGTPYGTTCAEAHLPRKERAQVRKADFTMIEQEALQARKTQLLDAAYDNLPKPFHNQPSAAYVMHVWRNEAHPYRKNFEMIIEARRLEQSVARSDFEKGKSLAS